MAIGDFPSQSDSKIQMRLILQSLVEDFCRVLWIFTHSKNSSMWSRPIGSIIRRRIFYMYFREEYLHVK